MTPVDLESVRTSVERPDETVRRAARELLGTAPPRGRLDDLAVWLSGVQASAPPRALERVALLRLGATGGGAAGQLASAGSVGTRAVEPSGADATAALRSGMDAVDAEVDRGVDLLVLAVVDPAVDVPASTLVGLLTRSDASVVTSRGAAIDDAAWMTRCAAVRDLMRRGRPVLAEQVELLDAVGSPDLAAATGVLLQAAVRKTPVLLDGPATAAAALVAQRVAFRAVDWWVASHRSPEPAHDLALDRLGLEPLLDLSIRAEDGTGALLAVPVLRTAAALGVPPP